MVDRFSPRVQRALRVSVSLVVVAGVLGVSSFCLSIVEAVHWSLDWATLVGYLSLGSMCAWIIACIIALRALGFADERGDTGNS